MSMYRQNKEIGYKRVFARARVHSLSVRACALDAIYCGGCRRIIVETLHVDTLVRSDKRY